MKIIELPRGGGKTKALIEMMLEDDNLIYVAPTQQQANFAFAAAIRQRPGISGTRFMRASLLAQKNSMKAPRVVVDELDAVLRTLLGAEVIAAAYTDKSIESQP